MESQGAVGIALIALLIGALGFVNSSKSSSASDPASSPSACGASNWLTRVIESGLGALTFTCTQPSYSDLTGTDTPAWASVTGRPADCGVGSGFSSVTVPTCTGFLSPIRLTGTYTQTNSTFHIVHDLKFSALANTNYAVWWEAYTVQQSSSPLTASQFAMSALPAGATLVQFCDSIDDATVTSVGSACVTNVTTAPMTCGTVSSGDPCVWWGHYTVLMGANAGTIGLDFRRSTPAAGVNTATINSGAIMWVSVVA